MRISLVALLLICGNALAVTEVGTRFASCTTSASASTFDCAGTVPAGTELLVCGVFGRGNIDITTANWNTSETMTELANSDIDGGGAAQITGSAFAIIDPTAATDNVTFGLAGGSSDWWIAGCVMFDVVDNTSVATATDDDTAVATQVQDGVTVVLPNFGASGNALLIFSAKCGDDSDPSSIDDVSYTEIYDQASGGAANTCADGAMGAYLQTSAAGADGGTVTHSGGNDVRGGFQIEINTEVGGSSIAPLAYRHYQGIQ